MTSLWQTKPRGLFQYDTTGASRWAVSLRRTAWVSSNLMGGRRVAGGGGGRGGRAGFFGAGLRSARPAGFFSARRFFVSGFRVMLSDRPRLPPSHEDGKATASQGAGLIAWRCDYVPWSAASGSALRIRRRLRGSRPGRRRG